MKPRQLFIADGALATILGILFVILPGSVLSILGISGADPARKLLVAFMGGSLVALGGFQLLARDSTASPAGLAFMRSNTVFDVIGIALSLIGVLTGIFNYVGWLFVVTFIAVGIPHLIWGFVRPVWPATEST